MLELEQPREFLQGITLNFRKCSLMSSGRDEASGPEAGVYDPCVCGVFNRRQERISLRRSA